MLASLTVAALLAATPQPTRILVIDIDVGQGVDVKDRAILTDAFAAALQDEAYRLVTMRDVAALLASERERQILGCSDSSCLAEIGGSIGTEGVARIAIGYAGETMILSGRIVETRTTAVGARATAAVEKDGMLGALRRLGLDLRRDYRRSHGLAPPQEELALPPPPPEAPRDCQNVLACEAACTQGEVQGCHRLVALLESGLAPPREKIDAAWDRACELGDLAACLSAADRNTAAGAHAKALGQLRRVCDSNLPDALQACVRVADTLFSGMTGERDAAIGARLADRACQAGRRDGCDLLGLALLRGDGVTLDVAHGAALLATSCDEGRPRACSGLLEAVAAWDHPAPGVLGTLERACERNVQGTCEAVIRAHLRSPVPERGVAKLEEACLGGGRLSPLACEPAVRLGQQVRGPASEQTAAVARHGCLLKNLALCLSAAEIEAALPAPDPGRMLQHLELGCAAPAQRAVCLRTAAGVVFLPAVQRTGPAAVTALERLCAKDVPQACHAASIAFGNGGAVPADFSRAALFARGAAEGYEALCQRLSRSRDPGGLPAPEAESCRLAAAFYAQGNGVPRNPAWARSLQEAACTGGLAQVCLTLGEVYEKGRGVDPDRVKAVRVYALGCKSGDSAACSAEARLR